MFAPVPSFILLSKLSLNYVPRMNFSLPLAKKGVIWRASHLVPIAPQMVDDGVDHISAQESSS
jgi:hypothetical protein